MTQSELPSGYVHEERVLLSPESAPLGGPILLIAYIAAGLLATHFGGLNTFAAPVWAPAGIALAGILMGGRRYLPWVLLASFAINLYLGASYATAFVIAVGETLEAFAGAWAIERLTGNESLFRTLRNTLVFLGVAYVTPVIGATIGAGALWITGFLAGNQFLVTWLAWRSGDTLGLLIITPLILTWVGSYRYPVGPLRKHAAEAVALLLTLCSIDAISYLGIGHPPEHTRLSYLISLPLAWAAVRFGPRGVATAAFFNLLISLAATLNGLGPYVAPNFEQGLLFLQIYVAVTTATFLIFAAIVKDLINTRDSLQGYVSELEYALRKIRSEDKAKADFLAELAHELRNPLAPVLSGLEIITLRGLASPEAEEAIDVIRKQTSTMAQLLNDLLDISRVSRRKVTLSKKTLDLRNATKNALDTVDSFMKTRRHRVITALGQKPLWVEADSLRLEQIIVNLLNNAAKYTNPGGTIRVSARKKDNMVIFSVEDNGIGIPKDLQMRVFEPFLQGSQGTATRAAGLGIGLSLTKHLVELHRGTISVFSDGPGKGSEFVVRLPAATAPAAEPALETPQTKLELPVRGAARTPQRQKKRRVLIVDDNERAAQTLSKLVAFRGHDVRVAYDGPSALAMIPDFKPHIAVLDIGLPHMDGYELARRLRETGRPMTLVALTGYGLEEDKRKALVAGFDYHLVKPVSISDLEPVLK